jgi:3-oxoacyl-[acyl-carrier-protein] synthase III
MGTIIEAVATATADGGPASSSAIELTDAAAATCLDRAGRRADDVQLLINAGVYLDRNISEPAIAALIQEDIGANLEIRGDGGQGTLSFDVRDGACGLLTGMYLIDGLLASGAVERGMVVGGDVDPEPGISEAFDFPAAAGAILLGADDSAPGLTAFKFATFPQFVDDFRSFVAWHEEPRHGQGRNTLTVEIDEHYAAHALDCAESTVRELAAEEGLDLADIDLLVATASVPGFADALARRLGIASVPVASPTDGLAGAHTAALALALESVPQRAMGTALIVCAGAGITVVGAVYRA